MSRLAPSFVVALAVPLALAGAADAQECPVELFPCAVERAVGLGLRALRDAEGGAGVVGGDPSHNAHAVLAFLEDRQHGFIGRALGFSGLSDADQLMVIRLLRAALDADPALTGDGEPQVAVTGRNLEALSSFIATGGPDEIGAEVTVIEAITNGVAALHAAQRDGSPDSRGAWSDGPPDAPGDLAVTLSACRGLNAAANIIDGADAPLQQTVAFLEAGQRDNADGGSGQRPGLPPSSAMTAAALWCYRAALVPGGDPRVQRSLGWLHDNWTFDRVIGEAGDSQASVYFYFRAVTDALWITGDDGLGGALYAEAFGIRDPEAEGFPRSLPSARFDVAITLLGWQDPDTGLWGTAFGGSPEGRSPLSSHTFALLTLERSYGGIDYDNDGDGLIDQDDNCPEVANPGQDDFDDDGVGDACDNCVEVPDRTQADSDMDGIGDACDPQDCTPVGPSDGCDGIDNDCDGIVDEGDDLCPEGLICAAGECVDPCDRCGEGERCVDGGCVPICPGPDCPPEPVDAEADAAGPVDAEADAAGLVDAEADGPVDAEADAGPVAPDARVEDAGEVSRDPEPSSGGCACDADGEGPPGAGWLLVWGLIGLGARRRPGAR